MWEKRNKPFKRVLFIYFIYKENTYSQIGDADNNVFISNKLSQSHSSLRPTYEIIVHMRGSKTFYQWGVLTISSKYFTEGRTEPPREAIGPEGSNCFSRGSVPDFLRKPNTTCDFAGRGSGPPVPTSGSAHGTYCICLVFLSSVDVQLSIGIRCPIFGMNLYPPYSLSLKL